MIELIDENIKLIDIKNIYEYCVSMYNAEGLNAKFSYVIFKNVEALKKPYEQILEGMYLAENDPAFQQINEMQRALIFKYADRKNNGEIIYEEDGKTPKLTEMIIEYQRENEKIISENAETLKQIEHKVNCNDKFLEQDVEIKIYKLGIDEIPNSVPPYIVGFLAIV